MMLFHGSIEIVSCPEIRIPSRTLDYGNGFYTTTSYQQAEDWVRRRMSECKASSGYINIYEFDYDTALKNLSCLVFEKPTTEWVDFVMNNRTQRNYTHKYDIVYGPVANDRVYAAFALYEGGFLDKEHLITELKTYKLVDQYLFHTEKALQTLKYIRAEVVK